MKTHLFIREVTGRMLFLLFLLFFINTFSVAQECACNSGVNVAVGGNGSATVTAAMMLASNNTCGGTHTVTVMKTTNGLPIAGSPNVNCTHVGQTLYAKVTNGTNSCWGTIVIMDEMIPVITPPVGILNRTCVEMLSFVPTVVDNCPGSTVSIVNETTTVNTCANGLAPNVLKRITRTYQATDKSNNKSTLVTFIFDVTIIADLNDIDMPLNLKKSDGTNLECLGNWAKIPVGQPFAGHPSPLDIGSKFGTGVPSLDGSDLYPSSIEHCKLFVTFTDIELPAHKCVTKIIRRWEVYEESCLFRTIPHYDQLIEIADTETPVIDGLADMTVSTSNHACEASFKLPSIVVEDNCSLLSQIEVDVTYPGGFNNNTNGGNAVLPVGDHIVTYTAYDWCGNSSSINMIVTVSDNTSPVSICDEFTTVALANEGVAHIPAFVLDDGSYDECSAVKMVARRMNNTRCTPCETPEFTDFHFMGEYGTGADKHYYYLSKHTATPEIAFKNAKALGGNVVTIETAGEDTWLWNRFLALVKPVAPDWIDIIIGLSDLDRDGKYTWQSGSTSPYRKWAGGSPANTPYVVKYHSNNGDWFGYSADLTAKYVVEITDPCSWSSHVKFCCADLANDQMVAFRTIDKAGNFNDCMVSVKVQDKIGPTITCPDDMTVDCDFSFNMEDLVTPFGWPEADDNCEELTIEEVEVTNTMNACRIGSIRRDFEVTDLGGRKATCFQTITFEETVPFVGANIDWPDDYMNLEGCADPKNPAFSADVLGRPTFGDGACALVGADFEDKVFSFNNGNGPACFKILRYWTVIDWCQTTTSPSGTTYKTWTHTQTIVVNDNESPVIEDFDSEISVCTYDPDCEEGHIDLIAVASDNCTKLLANSYKIDAFNNGSFDIAPVNSVGETIDASGIYPIGTHKIVYTFEDKCGNLTTAEQLFTVVNCKAPTPVCHNGLSVNLTPMDLNSDGRIDVGMATVDISLFDKGSSHICGTYDLIFSYEEITLDRAGLPIVTSEITYDCNDLGEQPVSMYVGIITPMGVVNQSVCTTFIDVQDNLEACEGRLIGGLVSGKVATQKDEMVENVSVELGGTELDFMTKASGEYVFSNLASGFDYQVNPSKNDDVMNGISTLDLVWIQRHILGIESLGSPYTLIAADINKDKSINTLDLVELRKVILGTNEKFPANTSWRFVDKQYKFINPSQGHEESFNEKYDIFGFSNDMVIDFVGVKTGDVDASAKANGFSPETADSRSSRTVGTTQTSFAKGELVRIPVYMNQSSNINGIQFTMEFDASGLELVNIVHEFTNDQHFGMARLGEGKITFSWNDNKMFPAEKDNALMTLEFMALHSGNIAEAFEINSSVINAEMYDGNLKTHNLVWKVSENENSFVVHQNIPNPFSQMTEITFDLPEAGEVHCTIRDLSGKLVKEVRQFFDAGSRKIIVSKSELPANGVYFYTVQSGQHRETKMMVVIE
ncbi:MAG: T9SS type A sorting domain-containing protein [Saprospiraceae bacterium]|nr:T9SS type A sorting domain-containing protein [Saprospiraceae bacterium]